jgi:hypothetical protein
MVKNSFNVCQQQIGRILGESSLAQELIVSDSGFV